MKPQNRRSVIRGKRAAILVTFIAALVSVCLVPSDARAQTLYVLDNFGYVGDPLSATVVSEFNAATGAAINVSFPGLLRQPEGLAVSGNTVYVTDYYYNVIVTYNAATGAVLNPNFATGLNNPVGLAIVGNHLFVANYTSGVVGAYDATTGAEINASFITEGPLYKPLEHFLFNLSHWVAFGAKLDG